MKLFKFLIIDDSIINECFKPILNDEIYGVHQRKRNRIYKLNTNEDFMIMSFTYPNINSSEIENIWAYTIIDKSIYRSLLRTKTAEGRDGISRKYQIYKWGTVLDKKGDRVESTSILESDNELESNTIINKKMSRNVQYIKKGGHLSAGAIRLHEFVYLGGEVSLIKTINRKKQRIHHKGHTFDNRREFLELVDIAKHRFIHNKWERSNDLFRPEKIELGIHCTEEIICSCEKIDCHTCNGVLNIKTKYQLETFLDELNNSKYVSLSYRQCYEISDKVNLV